MNHPTLRTIGGASAPATIDAKHTALLVIDFQNEYFGGKLPIPDGMAALRNAKRLVAFADEVKLPVFHVQHVSPPGAAIFADDGATVQFHSELQPKAHHTVVQKTSVSVFPTSDIHARLKAANIQTLIITGLMTHMCVTGAARDAVPLGYQVVVVDDACASRDLDQADGSVLPHAVLHRAALAAIADGFGAVLSTEELLQLPLV
ncbi:isochorismatase family protein [Oxalobacteraceae bacterium]|nr:isochorismatase family protein [Oxalobacteraceae bacterium]